MSSQYLSGKVIAITGAGSGIGLATARYLAERGASLSLADIAQQNLEAAIELVTKHSPNAKVIGTVVDVSKTDEVEAWIQKTVSHLGKLDGGANLAGVFTEEAKGIVEMSDNTWDWIIGINLTGLMYCLRAQLKAISDGGSIVNATSVAGMVGSAQFPAYSTSKHGVIGLTKCAAREAGSRSVRVNVVCPGRIETPMMARASALVPNPQFASGRAIDRPGEPEEVAALIAFLLGDESKWITGSTYVIDGGRLC
ncbi:uncharacterized protein A1O5_09981 [Cladophialophora psammophila CBS 110553]|uniref:3-oxoacyl-[acyl-carrier protein] reductase n=1 Tax=Cladophialophora psammophila CBS 110553 TaxID=1182543 RepID=W9WQ44_9EURO|nr:uncharacterized protein A1O5_09981 [Cladophialophora psammophila CBS 110553]EXJ66786.1 hypothetical protein A1O5_09981 [Cladophialophora psammophila CBS 110553]